jgi:glycosyltransferase involved in cell wall biosynthesis
MRIGIDCRTILNPHSGERAGVGHYVDGLVSALIDRYPDAEFVLYFDYRVRDISGFARKNVKVKHFPFSQYGKYLSFGYSHMLITAYLLKEGLDVLHVPAGSIPFTYPKKVVYTVHDLAIFKHPEWFPSSFISRNVLVPQTIRKADAIIAVSASTAHDLKQLFNVPSKKVSIIHHGFDVHKIPLKRRANETIEKYKLPKRYVLFVGTIEPRKNVEGLMRAFVALQEKNPVLADVALVLAGQEGYHSEQVMQTLMALKTKRSIRYIGYVTHNEKVELLRHAAAFVFPSFYEGFGLPILEAMALGVPVVTSKTTSMPEIAERAALFIDPTNVADITRGLREVLTKPDVAKRLHEAGPKQAAKFSWLRCAEETMAVYQKVAGKK